MTLQRISSVAAACLVSFLAHAIEPSPLVKVTPVLKTSTTSLQTFASLNRGPAGLVHTGKVEWFDPMDKKIGKDTPFSVDGLDKLQRGT